ncbi:MAG: hypothetical protein JJU20_14980 [Opitutales bacterium]|nr:hypothetical protein [Opitutales bacterium]
MLETATILGDSRALEYSTLAIYFAFLIVLGGVFARLNKNLSDFARGGSQLTWWMVGTSMTMAGISAFTFTGNASAAFEAGPSLLIIYLANVLGYAAGAMFLGPWYRQTRAYTSADVIRGRFGTAAEQFSIYLGLFLGPVVAAVQLWALAIFVSSVFGFSMVATIVLIGSICILYSAAGGSWAVVATDFVQGIVLFSITILVATLALVEIGGLSGFLNHLENPEIAASFKWIHAPGEFSADRFTWGWAAAIFTIQLMTQVHLSSANRYLAVKDGREARRAALLALILMSFGSMIWFFPPMVARMLYADQVLALGLDDPATASYAITASNLLPTGLMGVMIAAMFAATMSSLDTGLTAQASTLVRNLIPRIRGQLGYEPMSEKIQIPLCRALTIALGCIIISLSILLSLQQRFILFDAYYTISSVIGLPTMLPLFAGILFRRMASWSYFFIFGISLIPSIHSVIQETAGADPWTIQHRAIWVLSFGTVAILITTLLNRFSTAEHKRREFEFFKKMHTPVDFEKEVGIHREGQQARVLGTAIITMGSLLMTLVLLPNPWPDRLIIAGLAAFVASIGIAIRSAGRCERKN